MGRSRSAVLARMPGGTAALRLWRLSRGRYDINELTFGPLAEPAPLVSTVFDRIRPVQGFFTWDDVAHFSLVLGMQSAAGHRGDLLEIGCFYGRSTAVLAGALQAGEQLVVCDPLDTVRPASDEPWPSEADVWRSVEAVSPGIDRSLVDLRQVTSRELRLSPEASFRFIHVDGSHDYEDVVFDLDLAAAHLADGGVLVIDDYAHPWFPGVTRATDEFLAVRTDFTVLADLNRHGENGRKIYLVRARS